MVLDVFGRIGVNIVSEDDLGCGWWSAKPTRMVRNAINHLNF
jgi:hypothetical protein